MNNFFELKLIWDLPFGQLRLQKQFTDELLKLSRLNITKVERKGNGAFSYMRNACTYLIIYGIFRVSEGDSPNSSW